MNYFYYIHGKLLFFLGLFITLLCLASVFFIVFKLSKRLKFIDKKFKLIMVPVVFIALFGSFFGFAKILDPFHQGGVKEIYIFNADGKSYLTTWLTRYHFKRFGADYDQRLETFELNSGKLLGIAQMVKRHYDDEYRIYWSGGDKAWGYSTETGIQLLDMQKPKVLATEQDILKQNSIGKKIKLYSWGSAYSPQQHALYVVAANGQYYRLGYNLKATPVKKVSSEAPFVKTNLDFAKNWQFYYLRENLGAHLHIKGATCSPESKTLLEPKFISEQNTNVRKKDKVWVRHKSGLYKESDLLLSYIAANGEQLNSFNLTKMFDDPNLNVISTFTREKNSLIFIGVGDRSRTNTDGFALYALRVDKDSGELLGKITYIE